MCQSSDHLCGPLLDSVHYVPLSRGEQLPPLTCWQYSSWCSPRMLLLVFLARVHSWVMFDFLSAMISMSVFRKSAFHPTCPGEWGYPSPGARLSSYHCWAPWGPCWPISPVCQSPAQPSGLSTTPRSSVLSASMLRVQSVLSTRPLMKMCCPQYQSLGCTTSGWSPDGFTGLITTLWAQQFRWFSVHFIVYLCKPYFITWECYERNCQKPCWSQGKQHLLLSSCSLN